MATREHTNIFTHMQPHKRMRRLYGSAAFCLALSVGTHVFAAQSPMAPASAARPALAPTINPAALQSIVRTIATPKLVYLGDYAPMAPKQISTGVLIYLGDYVALPNQVVQSLTYTGAYPPIQAQPLQAK